MQIPSDLFYSKAHLWVKKVEKGLLIGITDYAQESLGELQYLDLPHVGEQINKGLAFGAAETSKSVSDLLAPLDALIAEVNPVLNDSPETINNSPYDEGWLLRLTDYNAKDLDDLLDAQAYEKILD